MHGIAINFDFATTRLVEKLCRRRSHTALHRTAYRAITLKGCVICHRDRIVDASDKRTAFTLGKDIHLTDRQGV